MTKLKLLYKQDFVSKDKKNYSIVYFINENKRVVDKLFPTEKWNSFSIDDKQFVYVDSLVDVLVDVDLKGYVSSVRMASSKN